MRRKNSKVHRARATALIAMVAIAMMMTALVPAMAAPRLETATVIGTVTDINDGEPIAGARVTLEYHGLTRVDVTDPSGNYRFDKVPECYCLKKLTASKDGYLPETKEVGVAGVTVVDFELLFMELEPHEGEVAGTVTDHEDGSPLEGVLVELEYDGRVREYYTDQEGWYRFGTVPEGKSPVNVSAYLKGYIPETKQVAVEGKTLVDFELWVEEKEPPQDKGTIVGFVTDHEDGSPLEGVRMALEYHDVTRETYTDAKGFYFFEDVPECRCLKNVSAILEGFIPETKPVSVHGETVVDFELWVQEQEPPKEGGSIVGTVTDAADGLPIAGALVTLRYHDLVRRTTTDASGSYSFDDVPECYCLKEVTASSDDHHPRTVEVGVDGETVVDFALVSLSDGRGIPIVSGGEGRGSLGVAVGTVVALVAVLSLLVMLAIAHVPNRRRE